MGRVAPVKKRRLNKQNCGEEFHGAWKPTSLRAQGSFHFSIEINICKALSLPESWRRMACHSKSPPGSKGSTRSTAIPSGVSRLVVHAISWRVRGNRGPRPWYTVRCVVRNPCTRKFETIVERETAIKRPRFPLIESFLPCNVGGLVRVAAIHRPQRSRTGCNDVCAR